MEIVILIGIVVAYCMFLKTLLRFAEMQYDHQLDMQRMRHDHELEMRKHPPPPLPTVHVHLHVDGQIKQEHVLRLAVTTVTHMLTTRNN